MNDAPFNPMRAAQASMRAPSIKRFYAEAAVKEVPGGFAVELDGRGARTPGKKPLIAPSRAVAELIAAEFASQGGTIESASMPATRLANSALDGVAGALAETRAEIAKYAGSDLVCYRAGEPAELVALQAAAHDPVLDWALEVLGARFRVAEGVMFVEQPAGAREAFAAALERHPGPFAIAALHSLTSLSGSALIALMTARGVLTPEEAWRAAHVDEDFQISKWGEDAEAAQRRQARWREFQAAARTIGQSARGALAEGAQRGSARSTLPTIVVRRSIRAIDDLAARSIDGSRQQRRRRASRRHPLIVAAHRASNARVFGSVAKGLDT